MTVKIDYYSGNMVGKGEVEAIKILSDLFQLKVYTRNEFHTRLDGIYPQIFMYELLKKEQMINLSSDHTKSSVDIVMILEQKMYCIRVNNWDHFGKKSKKGGIRIGLRAKKDSLRKRLLKEAGYIVIDLNAHQIEELFKEKVNEKSINEVKMVLRMNGITWKE